MQGVGERGAGPGYRLKNVCPSRRPRSRPVRHTHTPAHTSVYPACRSSTFDFRGSFSIQPSHVLPLGISQVSRMISNFYSDQNRGGSPIIFPCFAPSKSLSACRIRFATAFLEIDRSRRRFAIGGGSLPPLEFSRRRTDYYLRLEHSSFPGDTISREKRGIIRVIGTAILGST